MTDQLFAPQQVRERTDTPISFHDYLRVYDSYEGGQTEWIAGEVAVYPMTNNFHHQEVIHFLAGLLRHFMRKRKLGRVIPDDIPMRISETEAPEPDLMVLLAEHEDRFEKLFVSGVADIAVEVVSPESDTRDYGRKRVQYEAAGVPEFWLFDPIRRAHFIYVLGEDGFYHLRALDDEGRITSTILPGFALDPEILWRDELPDAEEIVILVKAMEKK
ncbi:MAG: Uma2 family endonuclease [Chloroflexota bacterium]|nr:Uma2 family endonuclease [Chloroflexota bacterium]